jgi:hypothetical protein
MGRFLLFYRVQVFLCALGVPLAYSLCLFCETSACFAVTRLALIYRKVRKEIHAEYAKDNTNKHQKLFQIWKK